MKTNILVYAVVLFLSAGGLVFGASTKAKTPKIEPVKLSEGFQFGTNLWAIAWGGDAAYKNMAGPGELGSRKRYSYVVNWAQAYDMKKNKPTMNIWNPVFLEELKPYSFIRFIDWGSIDQPDVMQRTVNWSDRRLPTANHNDGSTVAFEWMIDLCNRTNKDAWICVPNRASDQYVEELAKLVRKTLKPTLKCYIEYSNETWNTAFQEQHKWCLERGKEAGLTGSDGDIPEAYTILRSFQIFSIFEKVYGKKEMSKRVVRTSCTFIWGFDRFDQQYRLVKESKERNPTGQASDILCIAPYVGSSLDGTDSDVAQKFKNEVDNEVYPLILRCKAVAAKHGLKFGAYEAGQHLMKNADKFSGNEEIYACYLHMFNKFCPEFDVFAHLHNAGEWHPSGAWGAKKYTGQSLDEAPKYRAIVDWVKANINKNK